MGLASSWRVAEGGEPLGPVSWMMMMMSAWIARDSRSRSCLL
jgi:hypothetical protein